jgi:hypothetical protein
VQVSFHVARCSSSPRFAIALIKTSTFGKKFLIEFISSETHSAGIVKQGVERFFMKSHLRAGSRLTSVINGTFPNPSSSRGGHKIDSLLLRTFFFLLCDVKSFAPPERGEPEARLHVMTEWRNFFMIPFSPLNCHQSCEANHAM